MTWPQFSLWCTVTSLSQRACKCQRWAIIWTGSCVWPNTLTVELWFRSIKTGHYFTKVTKLCSGSLCAWPRSCLFKRMWVAAFKFWLHPKHSQWLSHLLVTNWCTWAPKLKLMILSIRSIAVKACATIIQLKRLRPYSRLSRSSLEKKSQLKDKIIAEPYTPAMCRWIRITMKRRLWASDSCRPPI